MSETMHDPADGMPNLLGDHKRVSAIGAMTLEYDVPAIELRGVVPDSMFPTPLQTGPDMARYRNIFWPHPSFGYPFSAVPGADHPRAVRQLERLADMLAAAEWRQQL